MSKYYFVSTIPLRKGAINSRPCDTVEDALRGAKFMLGNGATEVSIVDSRGSVVVPAGDLSFGYAPLSKVAAERALAPFSPRSLSTWGAERTKSQSALALSHA